MLYPSSTPLPPLREPRSNSNVGAKKMNRASTISVMSGLGVPAPAEAEPYLGRSSFSPGRPTHLSAYAQGPTASPSHAGETSAPSSRSPSAGSFLVNRGRKMYNFFGHRPPSELISNHLAEYFPKVQKKVLERTARNSMMRISSGGMGESASLSTLR